MTIVDGTCKFCKRPLKLHFDDEYAKLRDPFGLMRLAACNRCGDYRAKRRGLLMDLHRLCCIAAGSEKGKEACARGIEAALRAYSEMFAQYQVSTPPEFDSAILESVMSKPTEYAHVLGTIRTLIQNQKQLL